MNKRLKAKVLALVMAAMMVFAMAPGMAFADEPTEAPDAPSVVTESTDDTDATTEEEIIMENTGGEEQLPTEPAVEPDAEPVVKPAPNAKITVTVSNKGVIAKTKKGYAMANRTVTVRDLNKDGRLTVHEAFIATHKSYNRYSKNARRSGYASNKDGWITKLWGNKSGNFLAYVNDKGIQSSRDTVINDGDHLYASINKDPGGNDWYTTFDQKRINHLAGTEFTLNLSGFYGMSFPEGVLAPVEDMQIGTWNKGKFRPIKDAKTDEDGNITLNFKKAGTYYVTARGTLQGVETGAPWLDGPVDCPIMAPVCVVKAKAAPNAKITVTVSNKGVIAKTKKGYAMANRTVTVRDLNKDGRLTVHEAFIATHKSYNRYSKNARRSGYASNKDGWITKLWGNKSGNFLAYVNDKGIQSSRDTVINDGDHLYASINKDPGGNDWYTTFDQKRINHLAGTEFTLNLSGFYGMSFPEGVLAPVEDMQIGTWNKGKFRPIKDAKTDEDGNITLNFKKAGTYYVTARGTLQGVETGAPWLDGPVDCPIMAPVCRVKVTR